MSKKAGDTFARNTLEARAAVGHVEPMAGIDVQELRSDAAKVKADEIALVRMRLAASATGQVHRAAEKAIAAGNSRMPDADYGAFQGWVTNAVRLRALDRELGALEEDYRAHVIDVREVDPYVNGSPHSFFLDRLAVEGDKSLGGRVQPGAADRLARGVRIAARAIDKGTDYGKALQRAHAEGMRQADVGLNRRAADKAMREFRAAITTGGGANVSAAGLGVAAFVTPQFLLDQWAAYRSPRRVVADQLNTSQPLPDHGMTCYIPSVTAASSVTTATEGAAVAEADPTFAFLSGPVVQKSGQLTISQAVLDRVGPGISADVFLIQQLEDQLGAQVDVVAINALLAGVSGANAVTNAGATFALAASGVGGFLGDLRKAKNATADAAGTRIRSTHLFTTNDFANFIEAYSDGQARPVFSPELGALHQFLVNGAGDPGGEGWTNYVLSGLCHFGDDNVPNSGSNTQLIVTNPSYTLLLEGPTIPYVMPQYQAGTLDPVVGVRKYVSVIPRYPSAVSSISGSFYAASQFV